MVRVCSMGCVNLALTNDWRRRTIHGREAVPHRANTEFVRLAHASLAFSAVRALSSASSASSTGTRPPSDNATVRRVSTRVSCCTHTSRVLPSLSHVLLSQLRYTPYVPLRSLCTCLFPDFVYCKSLSSLACRYLFAYSLECPVRK